MVRGCGQTVGGICLGCVTCPLHVRRTPRLDTHMTPEIRRTPLHEIVLSIKLLGLGEVQGFLAKCDGGASVAAGDGGLGHAGPTHTSRHRLPIEPRMGRMMVLGYILG